MRNLTSQCSFLPLIRLQFKNFQKDSNLYQLQPKSLFAATASEASDVEAGRMEKEQKFLQMVLSRFLPNEEFKEMHNTSNEDRLRFADLPVTQKFFESFISDKNPTEPLYDLPSYLANNYRMHDTSPKSPWFTWTSYLRAKVPLEQQRIYLAVEEHLLDERYRRSVMRQAQWELARLWDWQHRRVASGLPPEISEREEAGFLAARKAAEDGEPQAAEPAKAVSLEQAIEEAEKAEDERSEGMALVFKSMVELLQKALSEPALHTGGQPTWMDQKGLTPDQRVFLKQHANSADFIKSNVASLERRWSTGRVRMAGANRIHDITRTEYDNRMEKAEELLARGQDISHLLQPGTDPDVFKRQLTVGELVESSKLVRHWNDLPIITKHKGDDLLTLAEEEAKLQVAKEANAKAAATKRLLAIGEAEWNSPPPLFDDHGYEFTLAVRPPCPTFDLIRDYFELRYADVLARKDTVNHIVSRMANMEMAELGELDSMRHGVAVRTARSRLAPQEIKEINRIADMLFDENPDAYARFIDRLCIDGMISRRQADECRTAAALRRAEIALQTGRPGVDASAKKKPTPEECQDLHEVLTGQRPASRLAVTPECASSAQKLWEGSSEQLKTWAAATREAARDQIDRARVAGAAISVEMEEELLNSLGTPLSLGDASKLWSEYVRGSGLLIPPLPLEQVLVADTLLRRRAAGPDAETSTSSQDPGQLGMSESQARAVQETLEDIYQAHYREAAGKLPSWDQLRQLNDSLDLNNFSTIESRFQSATLQELLRSHWEAVGGPVLSDSLSWSSLSWEELYNLMKQVAAQMSEGDDEKDDKLKPSAEEATIEAIMGRNNYPLAGFSPAAHHLLLQQQQEADEKPASTAASSSTDGATGTEAAQGGSSSSSSAGAATPLEPSPSASSSDLLSLPPALCDLQSPDWAGALESLQKALEYPPPVSDLGPLQPAPPYPEARRLLRFTQTYVLHSASEQINHPRNAPVTMRVHAGELAKEVGLTKEAMQHILNVCSTDRYEEHTGDIVLTSGSYPNREENRKWLVELLNRLIYEGQHKYPSDHFLFDHVYNPFSPLIIGA